MAGTMPHAVFVETDLPSGGVAAYAAELPGCASFAETDADAVAALPSRVGRFTAWLRSEGEEAPQFIGDNWYEVERAAATPAARAAFSLDELPPSAEEFARFVRWLDLAREELADALDACGPEGAADNLDAIASQDEAFSRVLGGSVASDGSDPIARLYLNRQALSDALDEAGPTADGVRRILRLAIADDLRAVDRLRGEEASR
jgi:predicted RNase H-like HicB family nuclease